MSSGGQERKRPGNVVTAGILGTVTVRIRRVTTTRAGGVSAAPFDSFNMGDHVGDDPEAVAANRRRLAAAIGSWWWTGQDPPSTMPTDW